MPLQRQVMPAHATVVAATRPYAPVSAGNRDNEDLHLYSSIIRRVAAGESYYAVAADEHRKGHYPLRPFVTMRLPTLALVSAELGRTAMTALLFALVLATMCAWWTRLAHNYDDAGRRISAIGLLLAGMMAAFWRDFIVLHELWAGILLALAFALHRPRRWLPSLLVAACALAIRELALPFVLLWGAFALYGRRWREAGAIAIVVASFAMLMTWHAAQVGAVTTAADPASPGWTALGGWTAFVRTMQMPSALRAFPPAIGSAVIVLTLFGWASWRSTAGLFGTLMFTGYGVIFMILGRPDNFYWGFMVVPTFLIGLSFLPRAIYDLRRAISQQGQPNLDFAAP